MSDLTEKAMWGLAGMSDDSSSEDVLSVMATIHALKEETKALSDEFQALFLTWLKKNGSLDTGSTRYYVKQEKEEGRKFERVSEVMSDLMSERLLDMGWPPEHFAELFDAVLSINALKTGALKKSYKPVFDKWFEVKLVEKVGKDGKQQPVESVGEETEFTRTRRNYEKASLGPTQPPQSDSDGSAADVPW